MGLIDNLKIKVQAAKEQGAMTEFDADAVIGLAEGIDDEAALRLFKTIMLLIPAPFAVALFYLLKGLDGVIPEELQEKLYLDELEAAAKAQVN